MTIETSDSDRAAAMAALRDLLATLPGADRVAILAAGIACVIRADVPPCFRADAVTHVKGLIDACMATQSGDPWLNVPTSRTQ